MYYTSPRLFVGFTAMAFVWLFIAEMPKSLLGSHFAIHLSSQSDPAVRAATLHILSQHCTISKEVLEWIPPLPAQACVMLQTVFQNRLQLQMRDRDAWVDWSAKLMRSKVTSKVSSLPLALSLLAPPWSTFLTVDFRQLYIPYIQTSHCL